MIRFFDVSKTYTTDKSHPVVALQNLDLTVPKGEIFGFIGPNGAGKSTTIKLMLDLARPDHGHIEIDGINARFESSRCRVGYLPENPFLFEFLTAREYLIYAGRMSNLNNDIIQSQSETLLTKLKLIDASKRRIGSYSKGMQQRTAIAAALIHDPNLVVLDEPMSGLDPLGRKLIFDLIAELKEKGKTVFISSHVLTDIERLCDRVGIIVHGKLCFVDKIENISLPLDELFLKVVSEFGFDEVK